MLASHRSILTVLKTPVFLAALIVTAALPTGGRAAPAAARPPNIIFILADDLGYGDISCYGQRRFQTPNIDRLAADGIRFTHHYAGSSVCAPSRSVLLTGLTTGHTPVRGNLEVQPEGQTPLPAGTVTLAKVLQSHGYATGVFGKWGLGFPGSEGVPSRQGFDRFYGYNCQRLDHSYYPDHLWEDDRRVDLPENAGTKQGAYAPALIQAKTLEFIAAHRGQPFFLYFASSLPHAEMGAPEDILARHRGKYGAERPFVGVDGGPQFRQGPYASQPTPKAAYAAMIEVLDQQVGEIRRKVQELGLAENTIFVFTSDNGAAGEGGIDPADFGSAGPLRGMKRDLYEGGIRVPLIAAWPGHFAAGKVSSQVSAFWDWFPTFTQLAGVPTPQGLDGLSLLPTLMGRGAQAQHDHLYWEFHEKGGRVAVRQGDWKGVRYNVAARPDSPLELYNLARDPHEDHNVAAEHPEIVARLDQLLKSARTPSKLFNFDSGTYVGGK
jgi:arylsulfatase A